MAAGLGFKTFTTGEVLTAADTNGYLMQGVLVFASAAARDAAITSPQEGQCCYLKDTDAVLTYSGSAWVGFDDSNAIQNAIVDAKGDLITATAADTPARLAVGTNGQTLVADSTASTGLKWATPSTTFVGCSLQKATQSLATGTATALTWNVETNDSNGFHDNSTNNSRVTIPAGYAGKYLLTCTLTYDQSNGVGSRFIRFYKNGSFVSSTSAGLGSGGVPAATFTMTYTDIISLAVADYVEVYGEQASGGALSVIGNASGTGISNFNVTYLGA